MKKILVPLVLPVLIALLPHLFHRMGEGKETPEAAMAAWIHALETRDYMAARELGCWFKGEDLGVMALIVNEKTVQTYAADFHHPEFEKQGMKASFFQQSAVQAGIGVLEQQIFLMRRDEFRDLPGPFKIYSNPRLEKSSNSEQSYVPGKNWNQTSLIKINGRWYVYSFFTQSFMCDFVVG